MGRTLSRRPQKGEPTSQRPGGAGRAGDRAESLQPYGNQAALDERRAQEASAGGGAQAESGDTLKGWLASLAGWLGLGGGQKQEERPLAPIEDPALNPDAVTESVTDATYTEVEGTAFVKGEGDESDIDMNDVSQGRLGDCYLMAALAALAQRSPDVLRDMIKDNGDDTWTVTFAEGGDVVVDNQFPTRDGEVVFAGKGDESQEEGAELWVMLIEKAWAKLKGGGSAEGTMGSYEGIRGSKVSFSSASAMEAISGKSTTTLRPASVKGEDLFKALEVAEEKGWPCTMGVKNVEGDEVKEIRAAGLYPNHAYTITSVDAAKQTVQVYNPWGAEYTVPELSLETLQKFVTSIKINKS